MKTTNKSLLRISAIVFAGTLALTSCDKKEREQLKAQADSLEYKLQERDSAFNSIMNVMAEVETQIDQIKKQENLISSSSSGDFTPEEKTRMVGDLKKINTLIEETNSKVASLSSELENSNFELNAFKKRVGNMKKDLEDRETSIVKLQEQIEMKDTQIAELNTEVESLVTRVQLQTETIEVQNQELVERENDLNTAFFAVDTERKLKDEGLVAKEGGFLWLGRTTELQADAAQAKFTEVDIQNTRKFYIDSDKMEIVTEHPTNSYKLVNEEGKVKYLEVTDPSKFWKISKYLVVSVKS